MSAIQELHRYIVEEYEGNIVNALDSIGGVKRVRAVPDYAVMDSRLYRLGSCEKCGRSACVCGELERL